MTRPRKAGTPVPRPRSGASVPRSQRQRVAVESTLSRDLVARLDALCARYGASRSSAIEGAIVLVLRSGSLERALATLAGIVTAAAAAAGR